MTIARAREIRFVNWRGIASEGITRSNGRGGSVDCQSAVRNDGAARNEMQNVEEYSRACKTAPDEIVKPELYERP